MDIIQINLLANELFNTLFENDYIQGDPDKLNKIYVSIVRTLMRELETSSSTPGNSPS
jgi:hypothetical protein